MRCRNECEEASAVAVQRLSHDILDDMSYDARRGAWRLFVEAERRRGEAEDVAREMELAAAEPAQGTSPPRGRRSLADHERLLAAMGAALRSPLAWAASLQPPARARTAALDLLPRRLCHGD